MRGQHYLFIYILLLLFVMFNSGVYADDGTLVFQNEPTFAQLDDPEYKNGMYTTPSVHTTETLIQWANSCRDNVFELFVESEFYKLKRTAAHTAAYGGLTWKSKTNKLISTSTNVLTANYPTLFSDFVQVLITLHGKIDREQQYALVCKEVNAHVTKMNAATEQWSTMHSKATIVLARYTEQNTSTSSIIVANAKCQF